MTVRGPTAPKGVLAKHLRAGMSYRKAAKFAP